MTFNRRFLPALSIASGLIGCSNAPLIIDSYHPANADALEASSKPIPNSLRPDAATRRTQALLAERQRQEEADQSAPPADQSDLTPKPSSPARPTP